MHPPRKPETVDRGIGRVAKRVVVQLNPPGRLHLAAAGEFNRKAAAWEILSDVLAELVLEDNCILTALEERVLPLHWTPLQYVARHGVAADLQRLIELSADIHTQDVHGSTPLHNASRRGGCDMIGALLEGASHAMRHAKLLHRGFA